MYSADTTNFYRPSEVAVRPKHPKCKNEFVFRFSYFTFENEKLIRFSFFLLQFFENEKRKRNSFFVRKFENEKPIRYPFFVRKFENEKGKNGIYTDRDAIFRRRCSFSEKYF